MTKYMLFYLQYTLCQPQNNTRKKYSYTLRRRLNSSTPECLKHFMLTIKQHTKKEFLHLEKKLELLHAGMPVLRSK